MLIKYLFFLFILLSSLPLFATGGSDDIDKTPAFTGSLLAYSGESFEPGQVMVQPEYDFLRTTGFYNGQSSKREGPNVHINSVYCTIQSGLVKNVDIQMTFQGSYNHSAQGSRLFWNDTLLLLGFQLAESQRKNYVPNIRIITGASLPTGHYNNINPFLGGVDISGSGSLETIFALAVDKTFYPKSLFNPFNLNLNLFCLLPTATDVDNFSVYGGSIGTAGTIHPGTYFVTNFAIQYSLSSRWAIASDIQYYYQNSSRFSPSKRNQGTFGDLPSLYVVAITPGLEYTVNDNLGLLAGVWMTVAGRNALSFLSGYFTLYYYF